jgi:4-alpha-glucanotransferase
VGALKIVAKTDAWGIEDEFRDAFGVAVTTSDATRAEVLRAMGVSSAEPAPGDPETVPARVWVVSRALPVARQVDEAGVLELEDGTRVHLDAGDPLPELLPLGYHRFVPRRAATAGSATDVSIQVLVTPGRCFLPDDLRIWGWAAQVYAARSHDSWGIGDLADLATLGAWTRALGGGAIMVNPLCAPAPVHPIEPSPYYPSSRRFRNPLFLRIEDVPGAQELASVIAPLAEAGRALNRERLIDRDRIFDLKMRALEQLWAYFPGARAFDDYRDLQGSSLGEFAAFAILAERHGKDWRQWPVEFRHPALPAVKQLIAEHPRIGFHAWLQWLIDEQLRRASIDVRIIHDLPIGFDIAGADGWCWQDVLAQNISIGCPPDVFNLDGQDWGLAPFIPERLRAARFVPFIETVRAMLRHAGGLRIDHVMGLFRLFWIPRSMGARGGTYVRYLSEELLAIVAIESHRAKALIVGEDLGTVSPGARELLASESLMSYRLLFFEPDLPATYPRSALASVTTHDLATIAGIWTGEAIEHMRSAGVTPNEEGLRGLKAKLAEQAEISPSASVEEAIVAIYGALSTAPCHVLLATLEDALMVAEQPNMPGTVRSWPNWSIALPLPIEDIRVANLPRRIAALLERGSRAEEGQVGLGE